MGRRPARTTLPKTLAGLRAWLRGAEEGRKIVRAAAVETLEEECRKCQRIGPLPKVLVVVRRLGSRPGVEVFHETGVSVRITELVDSRDDTAMEILCEDLLRDQLPRFWKPVVDCRSQSQVFSALTIERQNDSLAAAWILKELKNQKGK